MPTFIEASRSSPTFSIATKITLKDANGKDVGGLLVRLERARRSELAVHAADESLALVDAKLPTSSRSAVDSIEKVAGTAKSDLAAGLKTVVDKLEFVVALVDKVAKVGKLP